MRIRHLVCVGAIVVLTACGGGSSDSGSDEPAAKKTTTTKSLPPLSEADAKKALLTLDDLPDGWQVDPDDGSGDDVKVTKGSRACKQLMDGDDDPATAKVSFKEADEGPFIAQEIYTYESVKANKEFTDGVKDFAACRSFTMGDSEFSLDLEVERVEADDIGDDSAAFRAVGTFEEGFEMNIEFVFVRLEGSIVSFTTIALGEPFPHDDLTELVTVGLDRLDRLEDAA